MNSWYSIEAKAGKTAKVVIYEQIGENWWGEGVSAKQFVKDLDALDVDYIDLHINSPGGNVFDGNTIYNALKRHNAEISVVIDGVAASMASLLPLPARQSRCPKTP
jgi:ATP-dependent Clp protease, protease subunit